MGDKKNLDHAESIEKIVELVNKIHVCMFCTKLQQAPFSSRPMGTMEADKDGNLWFFSNKDSDKNHEVEQNPQVQLLYSDPSNAEFICIFGNAEVLVDKEKAKELWKPLAKVWFQDGPEDANLGIIKVTPTEGHYWDTKHGRMVAFAHMLVGVVTGQTMDDGVEGQLAE